MRGRSVEACRYTKELEADWGQITGQQLSQQRERRQEWVAGRGAGRALAAQSPGTEGIVDSRFEDYPTRKEGEQNIACRGGNRW